MRNSIVFRNVLAAWLLILFIATGVAKEHSATLPVLYIETATPADEITREEYVKGRYWLNAEGCEGVVSLGSQESPLSLQIRGRGNWSWVGFDKKPWRLLLDSPAALCGLKSNDYFGLHAHADDNLGFLRNTLGFELSRRLKVGWTPSHTPVELYFNGEYQGLYFCTELVRVEPDRVNVYPQESNSDADVTGGWLIEIDNYDTDPHITITEGNGQQIIFSHKTPLELSNAQRAFLTEQMTAIDRAVYTSDKSQAGWAEYIDIDRLARFYIVHELMDNTESFHGSCFLHRDRGEDSKWEFGPVWDFGSSFFRGSGKFIWQDSNYTLTWIAEMYKFPEFQNKVKEVWKEFCENSYDGLDSFIDEWSATVSEAARYDFKRWPKYGNEDIEAAALKVKYILGNKARWLGKQWGTMPDNNEENVEIFLRGTLNTWGTNLMMMPQADGTYMIEVSSLKDQFKIASADFSTVNYGGDGVTPLKAGEVYHLVSGVGGKNITVAGEILNAKVILDPIAQTLMVTGESIDVEEPLEIPIYFRGDLNTWATDMPLNLQPDGLYTIEISGLTGRFKIADSGFKTINLGGDGVTLLEPEKIYQLSDGGKNITVAHDVERALLTVDTDNKTLMLKDLTTVGVSVSMADDVRKSRIFTLEGVEIRNAQSLQPGIYLIVDYDGCVSKKVIRN